MAIMAITAICGILFASSQGQAVNASPIALGLLFVAFGTARGLGRHVVIRVLGSDIAVATRAGIGFVDGSQELGFINEQRKGLTGGVGFEEGLVGMTVKAGAVFDLGWW